eukprot:TRINITY_DN3263_c0_g1_i1.p1 TRINITY_DN3263_c0_g1~~TRINITY_DN3263_c0_g1_i1.p1  ORF type:complete len:611 (-),score=130.66 TRINITY_DN3263_c0_g1_i1:43-1875(-)
MDTQTKLEAETSNSNTSSLKNSQRSPSAAVNGEVQYLSQIVEKLDKDKRRSAWVNKPDALRRSISDLKELINDLAVSSGSDSSTLPHSMNSSTSLHPIIENESDNEWSEEEAPDTDEIVDIEHDGYSSSDEELQGKKKTPMVLKNTSELQATHFPTFATPQVGKAQRTPEKATKSNPRIAMLTRSESPNPKFNSTSTLFIQTTLAKPDLIEVLHCASKAIHFHLQKGEDKSEKVYFPLFDERTHPLMKEFDNKAEPTESDVFIFLKTIFEFHSMNSSTSLHPIIENESDNEWSEEEAPDTDEIVDIEHDGYSSSDEELQGKKKTPMVLKNTSELQATHFPTFATPQVGKAQRTPEKATKSNPRIAMLTRSESPNPKFNSTSTLFIQTTLAKPDLIEVLHCASKAIHFHLQKGEDKSEKVYFPLFDERTHPLMKEFDNKAEPTESDVFIFLKTIFEFQRMDVECVVMCVVYIERLLELTALTMDRTNWRRVCLGSIIVSSKVWEDLAVWNQDFLEVFHNSVTGRELHQLELQFLGLVQYRLAIPASTYAKYYFELRAFSHEDSKLPRRPIDKEGAAKLEARTNKTLKEKFQRRASSNDLAPMIQSRNAVLN